VDHDITRLEAALSTLREHYKDSYPDVRRLQAQLNTARKVKEKLEQEETEQQQKQASAATASRRYDPAFEREARTLDAAIEKLESQLKAKDLEAEEYRKAIQGAEKQIRIVQSRIEAAPISEQQYAEVIRAKRLRCWIRLPCRRLKRTHSGR
jgi:chromosome segregation ATPase